MTVNEHTSTICISFPKSRALNDLGFSISMKNVSSSFQEYNVEIHGHKCMETSG